MNSVNISGRLTKEPEVRYTQGNEPLAIARFTVAVDRQYKRDNQPTADFLRVVTMGKRAEFAEKWLKKGTAVEIQGRIETGSYEKDGITHYTTDIVAEKLSFAMTNKTDNPQNAAPQQMPPQGYAPQQMPPQGYAPQQMPPQGYAPQNAPVQQPMPQGNPQGFTQLTDDDIPF